MDAMEQKMLPIGIENFEEIRTEGFYYVDKTGMIKELLYRRGEMKMFTRPRRFGKPPTYRVLKCFFQKAGDKTDIDELTVGKGTAACQRDIGKILVRE